MPGSLITSFFFLGWWALAIIPSYLIARYISVLILTSNEKKYYSKHWNKDVVNYAIFRNNAFLLTYKYYAYKNKLPVNTAPTEDEILNEDWLKPYNLMRANWGQIESHFNRKAKVYWRLYLHIDN